MTVLEQKLRDIADEKDLKLLPENLKKGITCLGVTGTLEASTSSGGVKLFETIEEMNSSTGNTEGDLAIVYRNTLANMTADTETQYITFPDTVVLNSAITDYAEFSYIAVDSSVTFGCTGSLDSSMFTMNYYTETRDVTIQYTSYDGITYTRDDTTGNPVDFGTVVKPGTQWNDNLGYFMKVGSTSFTGLYKYSGTAWELAPTQLTVTADDVFDKEFYGANGIEQGTLQNIENLSKDNINKRVKLWDIFNSGMVCPSDVSHMFDGCTNLQTIPLLDTSSVTTMSSMFINCTNLTTIPLLDTSKVTNMGAMFSGCSNLTSIPQLNTSAVTYMINMFMDCTNLTTMPQLNTSAVTNMSYMFSGCSNLTEIPLLDISSVTNMLFMFSHCSSLSDDSLNNILAMCINATAYTGTKTLKSIGLTSDQATKCTTLSNYSAFIDAGWTTGY